jgi:hypothetical protein
VDPEASPVPAVTAPLPPGFAFELPSARQVVGRGLQLAADHAADLRRASLYVGLLVLATVGPVAVLFVADLPTLVAFPWADATDLSAAEAEAFLGLIGPLYVAGALALLGVVAVAVDGVLLAVALLGSRAARRPLTLRESIQRARQVFWRYGFAAFVVGVISTIASTGVGFVTGALGRPDSIGSNLFGTLVATIVTAPFGYVLTAIVIGDVKGGAALGRSVILARARPRLAVVVAVFAFLASTLEVLGIGVAFDVADQVASFFHANLDPAGPGLVVLLPLVAAALVAFGSLVLTVSAIAAAPQIAAFLGLTHYAAGLDRARPSAPPSLAPPGPAVPVDPPAAPDPAAAAGAAAAAPASQWQAPSTAAPERPRWMTRPMVLLVLLEVIVVLGGLSTSGSAGLSAAPGGTGQPTPSPTSPQPTLAPLPATITDILQATTPNHVTQIGPRASVSDALGDEIAGWPEADLASVQYAYTEDGPRWLLTDTFSCDRVDVACGVQRDDTPYEDGAVLFAFRMTLEGPHLGPRDTGEWAALFAMPRAAVAPASGRYPGASLVVVARWNSTGRAMRAITWNGHEFGEGPTWGRARWFGDTLLVIVPYGEIQFTPERWAARVEVTLNRSGSQYTASDWLRDADAGLLPFEGAPIITLAG